MTLLLIVSGQKLLATKISGGKYPSPSRRRNQTKKMGIVGAYIAETTH
jgi:hypothetical protein